MKAIVITGPTATGKTRIAVQLAGRLQAEIISADSRQVYRGMDIGTGKDLDEYDIFGKKVPCHLIDIVDAGTKYNVFEYQQAACRKLAELNDRQTPAIICGGSGMYIDAVLNAYKLVRVPADLHRREELDQLSDNELIQILSSLKKLHNTTDIDNRKRLIRAIEIEEFAQSNPLHHADFPKIESCIFGLDLDRELRRERITKRLDARLQNGMVEEVQQLLNNGISPDDLIFYGLEYKYLTLYLTGKMSFHAMRDQLNIAIHQFAKRQMTWFRKMEKEGNHIHWMDASLPETEMLSQMLQILKNLAWYSLG